eukprot:CAMPEP_0174713708 /NCGR_PEP_ID=MMETSP1094-20130205/14289_1 /TAXON_ID=156173 /ORGANISM="Chrysochromulina brevifilum, Strain UTEX LB 985" /LENGTH=156 /DNA_ID=CAMNT_0015912909 /DNA_START=37 /DNA_END=504 /DNA_ORIENTATION=+
MHHLCALLQEERAEPECKDVVPRIEWSAERLQRDSAEDERKAEHRRHLHIPLDQRDLPNLDGVLAKEANLGPAGGAEIVDLKTEEATALQPEPHGTGMRRAAPPLLVQDVLAVAVCDEVLVLNVDCELEHLHHVRTLHADRRELAVRPREQLAGLL